MELYHYRSIETALKELENGTFRFSSREEVNDPIEGYLRVYWRGDKAAWEGLFRNYICSLMNAIVAYRIGADNDILHHRTLISDLNWFYEKPIGRIFKDMSRVFLQEDCVQDIASYYGDNTLFVYEKELKFILSLIHIRAYELCLKYAGENNILSKDEAERIMPPHIKEISSPFQILKERPIDNTGREQLFTIFGVVFEDSREYQYARHAIKDGLVLYGEKTDTDLQKKDHRNEQDLMHRDWLSISVDFYKAYINQLKEMVYPEGFFVCFSAEKDNSSMWGNYADGHKGVCLVYETDYRRSKESKNALLPQPRKVVYGGEPLERNFFETFGRLTRPQIELWLTGKDGISRCMSSFSDEETWRNNYWAVFNQIYLRKTKEWQHENEYRMVIDNSFYNYLTPESRMLPYDYRMLKGVVFGIRTSENDKKRVLEALITKKDKLHDFVFYQSEFDSKRQTIVVREKVGWSI